MGNSYLAESNVKGVRTPFKRLMMKRFDGSPMTAATRVSPCERARP